MLDKVTDIYKIGDSVRVLMSSLHSAIRKLVKGGRGKYIVVNYSPEIYYVREVLKPRGIRKDFTNNTYTLQDGNGHKILTELN